MNAADQRRLTPWLIAICVALAAVWVALLAGVGRGVHWKAPGTPHPLPTTHQAAPGPVPPLAHYAVVWQRPLFTTTRQPSLEATAGGGENVSLDNLELTGVILAPGLHMALLRDRDDGHGVRVREGAHLAHGDWVLEALEPRSATFVDHGRRTRLTLKASGHGTAASAGSTRPADAASADTHAPAASPGRKQAAGDATQRARIQAIKQRIEQRRRRRAAHAGDH